MPQAGRSFQRDTCTDGNLGDAFSKRESNFYRLGVAERKREVLDIFTGPSLLRTMKLISLKRRLGERERYILNSQGGNRRLRKMASSSRPRQ